LIRKTYEEVVFILVPATLLLVPVDFFLVLCKLEVILDEKDVRSLKKSANFTHIGQSDSLVCV